MQSFFFWWVTSTALSSAMPFGLPLEGPLNAPLSPNVVITVCPHPPSTCGCVGYHVAWIRLTSPELVAKELHQPRWAAPTVGKKQPLRQFVRALKNGRPAKELIANWWWTVKARQRVPIPLTRRTGARVYLSPDGEWYLNAYRRYGPPPPTPPSNFALPR